MQENSASIKGGSITSSSNSISINMQRREHLSSALVIDSVITDSANRVGLNITGRRSGGYTGTDLTGELSNTFTGNTILNGAPINLYKTNGATAINGDIIADNDSSVGILRSNQIADHSVITLSGSSFLFFASKRGENDLRESFDSLVINGEGILHFNATEATHYHRTLLLNDIVVNASGRLVVKEWIEGLDRLLVKKSSQNLDHTLSKLYFEGYDPKTIGKRDYDKDYWEIYAVAPEPAAYGAGLMLGIIGFARYRRRCKCRRTQPER